MRAYTEGCNVATRRAQALSRSPKGTPMNRTHRNNHTRDAAPAYRPACRPARRVYSSHASATAPLGTKVHRKRRSRFNRARNVLVAIVAIAGLLHISGLANRLVVLIEPNAAATFLQFDEDEGTWSLVLVNVSNPLPDGFSVETADVGGGHSVDKRIADSLNAMLEDCRRSGYHPFIRSSFRTRDEQQQILNERVELYREAGYSGEDALSAALQWVALPGTSEHELGLAVDINDEEDDEGMYTWLASNAHQYGFILRYPLDKVDVTGISNEPWHYRYVGKQAAGEIYQTSEALEEYLARSK